MSRIKKARNSAYRTEVLVYHATISEPTPKDVSIVLIIPLLKITSFPSEIQSECFNIFLKNRKNNIFYKMYDVKIKNKMTNMSLFVIFFLGCFGILWDKLKMIDF